MRCCAVLGCVCKHGELFFRHALLVASLRAWRSRFLYNFNCRLILAALDSCSFASWSYSACNSLFLVSNPLLIQQLNYLFTVGSNLTVFLLCFVFYLNKRQLLICMCLQYMDNLQTFLPRGAGLFFIHSRIMTLIY